MSTLKLEANYRSDLSKGRNKQIRREGFVTGNVFGHNSESIAIEVNLQDLINQIKQSDMGVKSLIDLKIKGAPKKADGTVLIKDFLKDPLTRKVLDVQFQRISMKEKVHVGVPIEMVGDAPGIKEGGILEQMLEELQISCLPGAIPKNIEVDVTGVGIGSMIRVSELSVPQDIEILTDADALVVNCRPPHVTAPEPVAEEAEAAAEESTAEGETTE
jgi:large subunit ribosomal protein L25